MTLRKAILYINELGAPSSILDTNGIGYTKLKLRIRKGYDKDSVVQTYEDKIPTNREPRLIAKDQFIMESYTNVVTLDNNKYQARPQDEVNFRMAFDSHEDTDIITWILEDNTVVNVSITKLKEVYATGVAQIKAFRDTYIEVIRANS